MYYASKGLGNIGYKLGSAKIIKLETEHTANQIK